MPEGSREDKKEDFVFNCPDASPPSEMRAGSGLGSAACFAPLRRPRSCAGVGRVVGYQDLRAVPLPVILPVMGLDKGENRREREPGYISTRSIGRYLAYVAKSLSLVRILTFHATQQAQSKKSV